MASLLTEYSFDVFISYNQKDNKYDSWVTEFVANLRKELDAISKEEISIYFDENPRGESEGSLPSDDRPDEKLKCLIFIPIVSQTYCDPKSAVWQHEFVAYVNKTREDPAGMQVILPDGSVASRILPVKIREIDESDNELIAKEIGPVDSINFTFKSPGVNRSLTPKDDELRTPGQILYRDQLNKVANRIKDILISLRNPNPDAAGASKKVSSTRKKFIKPQIKSGIQKALAVAALLIGILSNFLDVAGLVGRFIDTDDTSKKEKSAPVQFAKSIAVMPFKNIGSDTRDEYFSDGMTEEVINYLAKAGELKVISRTSIEQYKGTNKDIREIAEELGVKYILEGSVRKADNTFRISVQLIQAETGFNLWSEGYDRAIVDILQVQSDISKEVTGVLKVVLTESERANMEDVQPVQLTAYDFYLKARSELMNFHIAGETDGQAYLNNAISLFKSSIAEDPTFPRAYSGLGLALIHQHHFRSMYIEKPTLDSSKLLADKTLELDEKTDEAHYVRGIYFNQIGKKDDAVKEFELALQLNPNYADAMMQLGRINCSKQDFVTGLTQMERSIRLGRGPELAGNLRMLGGEFFELGIYEKTEEFFRQAMRLDNDSIPLYTLKAHMERVKYNYESALHFSNEACRINPDDWGPVDQKTMILSFLGRYQEALDLRLKWIKKGDRTTFPLRIGYLYWVLGDKKKAMNYFTQMIDIAEKSIENNSPYAQSKIAHYDLAGIYAFLGDHAKAYQYLEDVPEPDFRPAWLITLVEVDPLFASINKEKRFRDIVVKMKSKNFPQRDRVLKWLSEKGMNSKIASNQ